jgi:hypothetical protein
MKAASPEARTNHHADDPGATSGSRATRKTPPQDAGEGARRASRFAKDLLRQIDGQVRLRPYVVLTVACAAAAAAGVALSSRILRGILTAAGTALAMDVLRELARPTEGPSGTGRR